MESGCSKENVSYVACDTHLSNKSSPPHYVACDNERVECLFDRCVSVATNVAVMDTPASTTLDTFTRCSCVPHSIMRSGRPSDEPCIGCQSTPRVWLRKVDGEDDTNSTASDEEKRDQAEEEEEVMLSRMDAACRNLHSRLPHIHARMFRIQQLKQKLLNSGHFPARIIQDQSDEQQLQQMVAKDLKRCSHQSGWCVTGTCTTNKCEQSKFEGSSHHYHSCARHQQDRSHMDEVNTCCSR